MSEFDSKSDGNCVDSFAFQNLEEPVLPTESLNFIRLLTDSESENSNSDNNECQGIDNTLDHDYNNVVTQDEADDDLSSSTCDDIPVLRHKGKRFLIDDDDSVSDSSQVT